MKGLKVRWKNETLHWLYIWEHVVTDWNMGGQEAAWDVCNKIDRVIDMCIDKHFKVMALVETATNHNHEELLESIDTFDVHYYLTL